MNLKETLLNPLERIRTTHIVAIIFLITNSTLFTDNIISITLQLILAFIIFLHHKDDENVKKLLLQSQNRLKEDKDIFDRNVIVSETDLDGIITYVNSNYEKTSGYTKKELIGSTHKKIRTKESNNKLYKELWETLNADKTFVHIMKNRKKDGSSFWVDTHISPIYVNSKKTGYKAIMFDITEKILQEENLKHTIEEANIEIKEQISRFEFVINSSRDGFWDYDITNKKFFLSKGWKNRLGFQESDNITYLDYLSLIPNTHRFEHHKVMHDAIEEHSEDLNYVHFRVQYPLLTSSSEKLIIEDVGNIFFDEQKNPIRITGFHRDITDQERQSKIIESQNRISAMGDMMANIAHQWRQPIGAINNVLNDLEFDIELEELSEVPSQQVLKTSTKVKEYTAYLSQTIDDFREMSSDEKHKSTFIVLHTLKNAFKIVENSYSLHNIHFDIVESGEISSEVIGYDRELQQVFINLLNNAKDVLTEKKIINPHVEVTLFSKPTSFTIIIHDNAGGVPENILPKIFDPYFTTKHESLGTGIGLYMSKNIITNYFKGTFEVENENDGAKFTITIPKDVNNV